MVVARTNHMRIINILLKHGADPNLADQVQGFTVLLEQKYGMY